MANQYTVEHYLESSLENIKATYVEHEDGKGLSTNDFDNDEKQKLDNAVDLIGDGELITNDKTVKGAINEVHQMAKDFKDNVATAITQRGVNTTSEDTVETYVSNIAKIHDMGSTLNNAEQLLIGVTAYSNGVLYEGTMEEGGGAKNVHIQNTAPTEFSSPAIWLDTTNNNNILKIHDGTNWITIRGTWG